MVTFKQYFSYIKDNPSGYWFKGKLYGWGWTPATWQGWLTVGILAAFLMLDSLTLGAAPNGNAVLLFFMEILLAVGIFIIIAYQKGEKPAWKWGLSQEEKEKYDG